MSAELQEVDIEQELSKSENEDIPELSIKTEPLNLDNLEKSEISQGDKNMIASLVEGSPEKKSLEEGAIDETVIDAPSLEEGEFDETVIDAPSQEEGKVDETVIANVSSQEEGKVDEHVLSIPPLLEEGEIDETGHSDSEEDSDDDTNFINLEEDINKNIIKFYHPETENINYKELLTLTKITRNRKGNIIDPFHKTIPFMTQYEKAKILGQRAKQINHGSTPFIDVPNNIIDGHTIALMELNQKKIPFIIRRPIPNGLSEYWKVSDLKVFV